MESHPEKGLLFHLSAGRDHLQAFAETAISFCDLQHQEIQVYFVSTVRHLPLIFRIST